MTRPSDFSFTHRLRVRWMEVDAQQVVFNGHYLTYLDVGISEYWRAVGLPYPEGIKHEQGDIFVRRNTLEYHAPARLDDWLDIGVRCERIGNSSITIAWAIWAQGRLLVTGETVYVHTSLLTGKSSPVPASVRQQIESHAQGAPVHRVVCGAWRDMADAARAVRIAVFVNEQGIDEAEEWDDDDAGAVHAVACNLAGLPLATGRLIHLGQESGHAKIGRMAVLRSTRGIGLGDQVLKALMDEARSRGIQHLSLNAQVSAQAFYARQGFKPQGEVFDEVAIPHQRMTLTL
ncbi:MAG: YbgC/FadM family acyl-CoA thioesterase [Aquabacterium sp.]|uniref:YbgC/FadM family acyl-CoA thioesterase n=1 Tax=Aquabacterium sp. TaxID=1872578 RepID=UPI0011F78896|nr:YbgC/FadM family acyl-CoA thioesterase [Aquabacterium sp.]TAK94712.1 MAG: YbgC/FadM family acyl-CoA thioesterase [Aquabacterium sp.]